MIQRSTLFSYTTAKMTAAPRTPVSPPLSVYGSSEVRLNTVLEHLIVDLGDLNETEMGDAVTDDMRENIIHEVTVEGNTYR
jgi:hypothetical protein